MDERVLVLAPRGRDAAVVEQVLVRAGMSSAICAGLDDLRNQLNAGAGAAIVTEEVFAAADTASLFEWLDRQPSWSDFRLWSLPRRRPGGALCGPRIRLSSSATLFCWNDL